MPDPSVDPTVISRVLDWVWAVALALAGLVWRSNSKRMDGIEVRMDKQDTKIDGKADDKELTRQRHNIEELFNQQRQLDHTVRSGTEEVLRSMHRMELSLTEKLNNKADRTNSGHQKV